MNQTTKDYDLYDFKRERDSEKFLTIHVRKERVIERKVQICRCGIFHDVLLTAAISII